MVLAKLSLLINYKTNLFHQRLKDPFPISFLRAMVQESEVPGLYFKSAGKRGGSPYSGGRRCAGGWAQGFRCISVLKELVQRETRLVCMSRNNAALPMAVPSTI